jgi:hypothetical protein
MAHLCGRPRAVARWLLAASLLPLLASGAWGQGAPPWKTPGSDVLGKPALYARGLHAMYVHSRNELNARRSELGFLKDALAHYSGTGVFGGAAMGYNDADTACRCPSPVGRPRAR